MSENDLIQTEVSGPSDAPILFFIHGWPDTAEVFRKQIEHFKTRYHCIAVTLPVFSNIQESASDFPEIADRIIKTAKHFRGSSQKPITIVGHDWGAFLTYLVNQRAPDLARQIVTMDVGAHVAPSSLGHAAFLICYQWWLVVAYLVGKLVPPVGTMMTRSFASIAQAPHCSQLVSKHNYLYFYFWRARLCKKYRAALPQRYKPSCPVLFLFGSNKKYHFHSEKWLATVDQSGGRSLSIPGGHWFLFSHSADTNRAVDAFLNR